MLLWPVEHIYVCEILRNGKKNNLKYEKIFKGTISEQIEVFRIVEQNFEEREKLKNEIKVPCDQSSGPLSVLSVLG